MVNIIGKISDGTSEHDWPWWMIKFIRSIQSILSELFLNRIMNIHCLDSRKFYKAIFETKELEKYKTFKEYLVLMLLDLYCSGT